MDKRKAILEGVREAATFHQQLQKSGVNIFRNGGVDIYSAIDHTGVVLMFQKLKNILGFCINEPTQGILVSTERPLAIRRFTAAHELGHIIMGHHGSIDKEEDIVEYLDVNALENPEMEIAANAFASEFLQPKMLVIKNLREAGISGPDKLNEFGVYGLSLKLGLSYTAVSWGLFSNNLIKFDRVKELTRISPKKIKEDILGDVKLAKYFNDVWRIGPSHSGMIYGSYEDVLQIELRENASTGYVWDYSELSNDFDIISSKREQTGRGYGDEHKLKLVVKNKTPGLVSASVYEKRPWLPKYENKIEVQGVFEENRSGLSENLRKAMVGAH